MFDETPTKEHVLVNAVLVGLYDRRPFKHDLSRMASEHPDLFQEMLDDMLDSVQLVLTTGDYRIHGAKRDLPTAQERIEELEAKVARLETLAGEGLEELHKQIMEPEEPPEWVMELHRLAQKNKRNPVGDSDT